MTQLETIVDNIEKWNQIRATNVGLNFLTSGYGIVINYDEYQKWKSLPETPDHINLYLGISELDMVFYVVDSYTDSHGIYQVDQNLFIKSFFKNDLLVASPDQPASIQLNTNTSNELLNRIFQWFFFSNVWYAEKSKQTKGADTGVVRAFQIPFNNLEKIFDHHSSSTSMILFFGLKEENPASISSSEADLILCRQEDVNIEFIQFEDLTRPCPPFSIANFPLLNMPVSDQVSAQDYALTDRS